MLQIDYFSLCQNVILSVLSHEEIYLNICKNVSGVVTFVIHCVCIYIYIYRERERERDRERGGERDEGGMKNSYDDIVFTIGDFLGNWDLSAITQTGRKVCELIIGLKNKLHLATFYESIRKPL